MVVPGERDLEADPGGVVPVAPATTPDASRVSPPDLIDSHCHLAHIGTDAEQVMADARAAGVDTVIDIGMGLAESAAAADRAGELEGVYAAAGIHPNDLESFERDPDGTVAALREIASRPGVVGIGETGLDFYRDRSAVPLQEEAFRAHIALARELDRTLVIHCRDAQARVLEVLDDAGAPDRVVMHCFSGDATYARTCAERRFYCSFAGNLTFRRSDDLRDAAAAVPEDLLLIETDAPFLAPHPFHGKPNAPSLLPYTARALADVLSMTFEALSILLSNNSRRVFALVPD